MKNKLIILGIAVLVAISLIIRLVPHPANFTPVFALALFAGFYLPKKWAVILPLVVMLVSDLVIGFYEWQLMLVVYSSLLLAGLIGVAFRKNRNILTVATSTLLVSILFFLTTNLAVWFFSSWYAHDWSGLMLCYTLAVPFFKNSLMGNLFFVSIFFGGYEFLRLLAVQRVKFLAITRVK